MRFWRTLASVIVVIVVPVKAVLAQTVDPTALIACVNVTSGGLRLVAPRTVCQPNEVLVTWSVQGPAGPQGAEGPTGPAGPSGPGALLLVDSLDQTVGVPTDLYQGTVVRQFGSDWLSLPVTGNGLATGSINFFHKSGDCSGDRYLMNYNGAGIVFAGQVHGTTAVYTRLVDPTRSIVTLIGSYEAVGPNEDITATGTCTPYSGYLPVGRAISVTDPALATLVPPFHVK